MERSDGTIDRLKETYVEIEQHRQQYGLLKRKCMIM